MGNHHSRIHPSQRSTNNRKERQTNAYEAAQLRMDKKVTLEVSNAFADSMHQFAVRHELTNSQLMYLMTTSLSACALVCAERELDALQG